MEEHVGRLLALVLKYGYDLLGLVMLLTGIYFLFDGIRILRSRSTERRCMIVLGSGGHTGEMFKIMKNLTKSLFPRVYMVATNDTISVQKADEFEQQHKDPRKRYIRCDYYDMMRIRDVGQDLIEALLLRFPRVAYQAYYYILLENPLILFCNGPGICVPLAIWAWVLTKIGLNRTKIIYIESICRVETLSLTGVITVHLADEFYVQWESLKEIVVRQYPHYEHKIKFVGRLS